MSLLTLVIISYSCKKDKKEENTPTPITYPNYSQLKVGNYWVYQYFRIDTLGHETPQNFYDSCYVQKDTVINGQTYYKMYRPFWENHNIFSILRDSLHYIIDYKYGRKLFSSQDFENILKSGYITLSPTDTICYYTVKMTDRNMSVVTPAGTFVTLNGKETYNMYPNYVSGGNPRYKNTRYAENIGIVIETLPFYTSDPTYTERRLVRYHLN